MRNLSKNKEFTLLVIFVVLTCVSLITLKDKVQAYEIRQEIMAENPIVPESTETLEDIVEESAIQVIKDEPKKEETPAKPAPLAQAAPTITVKGDSIAVVYIPSVGILGQVKNGTDKETIKKYIGRFENNAMPGENGNFAACAHNNIYTELFRNLYKVRKGADIKVITKTHEYTYKVESITKISPSQTEVLNQDMNKKEITLITCTDMAKNRISVKGVLVNSKQL